MVGHALLLQVPEQIGHARHLRGVVAIRQLENRALELVQQDVDVVRIDVARLRGGAEQILGMADDELVDRRRGGDQDRQRDFGRAARSARLLPAGGDGAGEPGHHRRVQPADVDAQLQRVGRHHPPQRPVAQPAFDTAPLVREVAAAIGGDGVGAAAQRLRDIRGDQLRARAGTREHDGLHPAAQQAGGDLVSLVDDASPDALLSVEQRWVVEQEVALPRGRAVAVDQDRVLLDDAAGQLQRVADGRRAADEARARSVERRDPLQAANDVGQVGAEHAAVDVQLVDHHEAQSLEELAPLGVMRQHARVQHVRIGDDDAAPFADRAPHGCRRVAVVGVGRYRQAAAQHHSVQLGLLVLRQRLGREQIERGRLGVAQEVRQDRQVVREGLSRGTGRDQHHVVAGPHAPVGFRLVAVQPIDAACAQDAPQAVVQVLRERRKVARARRHHLPVGDVAHEGTVAAQLGQHRVQRRDYPLNPPLPLRTLPHRGRHDKGAYRYAPHTVPAAPQLRY